MNLVEVHFTHPAFSREKTVSYVAKARKDGDILYFEINGEPFVKPWSEVKQARPAPAPIPEPEPVPPKQQTQQNTVPTVRRRKPVGD